MHSEPNPRSWQPAIATDRRCPFLLKTKEVLLTTPTNITSVGFIGLGDQGLPMATAIAESGFDLHVWVRRSASLVPLTYTAHVAHDSIASLASSVDVIALCVSTDDSVLQLVEEEILPHLGAGKTVINHGTGSPGNARRLRELAETAGIFVLDAPVSGGRLGAEARALTVYVGGPADAVDSATPVMQSYATNIAHTGDSGSGQMTKLLNNALLILNQAAIADVLELGVQTGLSTTALVSSLRLGSADSRALRLMNTMVTPDSVDHLAAVEALDMNIFDDAMWEEGIDASATVARGLSGADRLPAVIEQLN
ncbi:NAD(P)-dependent oxidoreductase [Brevibacterium marinum]|uniref:NAD(P)-dependent oxidoreductase n=1 Tax=Brevibacterium marinum TaxID=418643 RepID=UPI001438B802|nr:NAD(P)-dependent oxidoreductase [Brevibacterium marinum]